MPKDASTTPPPVDTLSYEQARDELVGVVARLEAGGETLETSLALWERGESLAARCLQWLDGARARLEAARPDAPDAPLRSGATRQGGNPDQTRADTGASASAGAGAGAGASAGAGAGASAGASPRDDDRSDRDGT